MSFNSTSFLEYIQQRKFIIIIEESIVKVYKTGLTGLFELMKVFGKYILNILT